MESVISALREEFSYDGTTLYRNGIEVDCDCNPSFRGKKYDHATLCWMLHYDKLPKDGHIIDHKNQIRADHSIDNLREATPRQNQQNKAGYGQYAKGVTWRDRILNPWQAKIRIEGRRIHLGSFATEDEAAEAYKKAALELHGEFACVK